MPKDIETPSPLDKHWKSYQTCIEMFHDRGYLIPQKFLQMTEEQLLPYLQSQMFNVALEGIHPTNHERIICHFDLMTSSQMGVQVLRDMSEIMTTNNVQHAVIVCEKNESSMFRKALNSSGLDITVFSFLDLYRNYSKHALIPKHVPIATRTEEIQWFKHFKLSCDFDEKDPDYDKKANELKTKFHPYLTSDPIVKYYGWRPGQMVEIHRAYGGYLQKEVVIRVVIKDESLVKSGPKKN